MEIRYLNKKETFIFMYTYLFLLSQVKINTKERINLQAETNKCFFWPVSAALSFFPHANASWLMTDQECCMKIVFFFEKKVIGHMTLESSRLANIALCYKGIAKFSWGDVTEWMSLQIKYVNLYYFLFNSLYNQVLWN